MLRYFGIITLVVILASSEESVSTKKVVCYHGTWSTYRNGNGKFDVEDIDAELCTHLVYAFVGLADDGNIEILDPYLDLPDEFGRDNFGKFNALKLVNPELKTLLAVGGWNEGSAKYSVMVNDPALRAVFVQNATQTVLAHGFDGLDMDWEYPNQRDTVHGEADVDNFTQLLRELREAFDVHGLLLTAAVSAVEESASKSYDIPAISEILDFVNIMTYDLHGGWDNRTGHNAGLHRSVEDEGVPERYTVDAALQYWLDQGCPPEKLIMGLPLYGRTFNLTDSQSSGVGATSNGSGIAGPYTMEAGFVGYNELCELMENEPWDLHYDSAARVPYAVKDQDWVTFDDADSLALKTQFALGRGLGGVMFWSIETDDFLGLCHNETFHIIKSVNRALESYSSAVDTSSTTFLLVPLVLLQLLRLRV